MAAQPGEAAQTAGLKDAKPGSENVSAREAKGNQGKEELPWLGNCAPWQERFQEKVQQRCLRLQEAKLEAILTQKAREEKLKKREACEWLFKEWLSEDRGSLETRIYLLDQLLPALIPGMEKLLMEVERKNVLALGKEPTTFNPLNFLGEYLMRHNPWCGISTKPGPYLRGMEMVTKQLKAGVPGTTSHRLATMKAEAQNNRKAREHVEKVKAQMKKRRKEELAKQFKEWAVDVSGRIPAALVQSALRSFPDAFPSAHIDVRKAVCDMKLEIIDVEKNLNEDEFTEYVHSYTEHLTHDLFQGFLKHLHQCAGDSRGAARRGVWRQMFAGLFFDCDCGKVGLLDRQKILALLTDFYDRSPVSARRGFCNPRQWPIIELQEMKLEDLWGGADQEVCEEFSEKLPLAQPGIFEGEPLSHEPVDDHRKGTYSMRPDVQEGLREEVGMSDTETGGISKEEKQAAESSGAELRREGEKDTSAVQSSGSEASGWDGDTTHGEKSTRNEDIRAERQRESAGTDRQEEASPGSASAGCSLSKDGEPGSEKQLEEEGFSQGREPDAERNGEEGSCILGREAGSEGQVSQGEDSRTAETSSAISGQTPGATHIPSEARAVADMDVTDSKQDPPTAEAVQETSAGEESSGQHESQCGQETGLQNEDKGPADSDRQDSPPESSQDLEEPWSDELLTLDLSSSYSSYGVRIPEDWKWEDTRFPDLHPIVAEIQNHEASFSRSAFDESCLNLPQFVQLMETFVGENISLLILKRFIAFIKEEYKQTEEEKKEQLEKSWTQSDSRLTVNCERPQNIPFCLFTFLIAKNLISDLLHCYMVLFPSAEKKISPFISVLMGSIKVQLSCHLAQRKLLLEELFEKWDSNASGFLDLGEVDAVLNTFKEGIEKEAVRKAKSSLCSRFPQLSRVGKLSPRAFQAFLELVAAELSGEEDEAGGDLVEFLTTRVEPSPAEHLQSSSRREWLRRIQEAAGSSGRSMEPVYKAVFRALSQDAEAHGGNKKLSAYIALLEAKQLSEGQGQTQLHYVACTSEDAPYVLNQILYRDMKGVSFAAVEEGKPIHVPRVQPHGNIHFWNYDRPEEERKGSFLVLPVHGPCWRVFGILGLDTLRAQCENTVFVPHEISFYQGVCHAFSKAFHHICTLENVIQLSATALDWLYPRAPSIHTVTGYLVQLGKDKTQDYALHKVIPADNTEQKEIPNSPVLLRKENLLRDYLFECTDSSEVVCTRVCGEHHMAVPLRDLAGQALGILDINTRHHQKLPPHEHRELQKMLKMLQAACSEILKMALEETEPTYVLEAEHVANLRHAGILFHRFMLQDLREHVQNLGAGSFADIKSQEEPPALVHSIVRAVLLLLHPDWKGSEKVEDWSQCKLKLDDNLIQEIYCFDPTAASVEVQAEPLLDCITGVPSSSPVQCLYHWLQTCLSLAEITRSLHSEEPHLWPLLAPTYRLPPIKS